MLRTIDSYSLLTLLNEVRVQHNVVPAEHSNLMRKAQRMFGDDYFEKTVLSTPPPSKVRLGYNFTAVSAIAIAAADRNECAKASISALLDYFVIDENLESLEKVEQKTGVVDYRNIQTEEFAKPERPQVEEVPEIGTRAKINQLVKFYGKEYDVDYDVIWRKLYSLMEYHYHFRVNNYKKLHEHESKLDIIEREGQLHNLLALATKELL